jgi:hypothetical protein
MIMRYVHAREEHKRAAIEKVGLRVRPADEPQRTGTDADGHS